MLYYIYISLAAVMLDTPDIFVYFVRVIMYSVVCSIRHMTDAENVLRYDYDHRNSLLKLKRYRHNLSITLLYACQVVVLVMRTTAIQRDNCLKYGYILPGS